MKLENWRGDLQDGCANCEKYKDVKDKIPRLKSEPARQVVSDIVGNIVTVLKMKHEFGESNFHNECKRDCMPLMEGILNTDDEICDIDIPNLSTGNTSENIINLRNYILGNNNK